MIILQWYHLHVIALELPEGLLIYADSLLLGVSLALGLLWAAWQAPQTVPEIPPAALLDAGLISASGALLGGRLAYVFQNLAYFTAQPLETLQVFQGGLAWEGAWLGAALALAAFAALSMKPLGRLADGLLPAAAVLTAGAWLGSWLAGRAYGLPVGPPWGLPAPDAWGEVALRLPVQAAGALFTLGGFAWLQSRSRIYRRPGLAASLAWTGLAGELACLSLLIADPVPSWVGLRYDTWAALGYAILGIGCLLFSLAPKRLQTGVRGSAET